MSFESLGLNAELLRAVAEKGYTQATPVQAQAIPHILQGRDILAGAQTGTGKTAGFTLPLLQRLSESQPAERKGRFQPVRALILAPTRELAIQVSESVRDYGKYLRIPSAVIFGGVKAAGQIFKLRRGPAILIATPGRLIDLVNQGEIDLSKVETLVLDEADRMLDMGFMPDIKRILAKLPAQRQNLMFSATYSDPIRKLAEGILKSPERVEVAQRNVTAAKVEQTIYPVSRDRKRPLLAYLLSFNDWQPALVFVRTKHGADRLAKQLISDGLRAAAIHGDKSQGARNKALSDFKDGRIKVLVATDVVARGLDINDLPHVVNFDLPMVAEDYVHRIGRTARAGKSGHAISLVDKEESNLLFAIEQLIGQKLPRQEVEGYEPDFKLNAPSAARPARAPGRRPQSSAPNRFRDDSRSAEDGRGKSDRYAKPSNGSGRGRGGDQRNSDQRNSDQRGVAGRPSQNRGSRPGASAGNSVQGRDNPYGRAARDGNSPSSNRGSASRSPSDRNERGQGRATSNTSGRTGYSQQGRGDGNSRNNGNSNGNGNRPPQKRSAPRFA